MKTILYLLLLLGVATTFNAQPVKVAAAADLKYAMPELIARYQKVHPNAKVEVNYGSSGMFFQQITNGALYDVYFSADISYPQKLKEQGVTNGAVYTYAFGALVLYSSNISVDKGIGVLGNADVKKIAIANPAHAPYGKRAEECLKYYKLYDKVKDKLILGENISQTAQYVFSGNADIGIVALSIALSPEMKSNGSYFLLDSKSYNKLEQGCVVIKNSKPNPEAAQFMQFVLSTQCKPIFEKYGFIVP